MMIASQDVIERKTITHHKEIDLVRSKELMVAIARVFHLLPFRTEKLSPVAPMVLRLWESRSLPINITKSHEVKFMALFFWTRFRESGVYSCLPSCTELQVPSLAGTLSTFIITLRRNESFSHTSYHSEQRS